MDGIFGAEHATPGVTEYGESSDLEVGEEVVELGDEELDRPEFVIQSTLTQVGGISATDLIVEDHCLVEMCLEAGKVGHVDRSHTWAAVEQDDWMS